MALENPGNVSVTETSRPASPNGRGLRITASTTEKMAVFAPMPSASVATAISVTLQDLSSMRNA